MGDEGPAFKAALLSKRKEDRIMDHVMKCFTFGKKLKRQIEDKDIEETKVDTLKKRFKRMGLLRQYYSVSKQQSERKFTHPLTEEGDPIQETIFDEQQYC